MDEAALIDLVRKAAIEARFHGYFEYESVALQERIRNDPALQAVGTPADIRRIVVQFIVGGGLIEFRAETREEYRTRRDYWFRANVPIAGHPVPLFFELELIDDDENDPFVTILNVHF